MEIWSLKAVGWGRMMIGRGKKFQKTRRFLRNFSKINMNENAGLFLTPNRKLGLVPFLVFEKKPEIRGDQFYTRTRKSKNKKAPAENVSSPAPALISIPRKPPSRTNSMR